MEMLHRLHEVLATWPNATPEPEPAEAAAEPVGPAPAVPGTNDPGRLAPAFGHWADDSLLGPAIDHIRDVQHGPVDPGLGSGGRPLAGSFGPSALDNATQQLSDLGHVISFEGLDGLMDPIGMMDRAAAYRELSSRFNVIDDDTTTGTMEQNQVTPEAYQQIVRTFSDIRLGRGSLKLEGRDSMSEEDVEGFRAGAMEDIADIMQTESGRDLITSLSTSKASTTVLPRIRPHGKLNPSNADFVGSPGRSSRVAYVPRADHGPKHDLRSDTTLYHELTHAYHMNNESWARGQIPGCGRTIGRYEQQAVGMGPWSSFRFSENRYRGERARIGALGVGERNHGFESDDAMTHRDSYCGGANRTTPAFIPEEEERR